jgi:hypothetical protein
MLEIISDPAVSNEFKMEILNSEWAEELGVDQCRMHSCGSGGFKGAPGCVVAQTDDWRRRKI